MPNPLSGPGVGLPYPQNLYPSDLYNAPIDASSNRLTLSPGESLVFPAGDWYVTLGMYNILQFLDPVTGVWVTGSGAAFNRGQLFVKSDGFNARVANLTGCVVSASVINGGTGYVQATTTITAIGTFNNAAPTFLPIVGGALGLTGTYTIDVPTAGAGYGIAPLIMIPPPPPAQSNANGVGGIPATAYAILGTSGTIASISITNPGAGYPSAPTVVVVPSPFDPNLATGITQATVAFSLASAGAITGEAAYLEQVAPTAAKKRTARHGDSPIMSTQHLRRRVSAYDSEWGDLVDQLDKVRLLIDPASAYARNAAMAMNRAYDDEIIGSMWAAAYTGHSGGTTVTWPNGNAESTPTTPAGTQVGVNDWTYGNGSGNAGLTISKLISACVALDAAEGEENEERYMVLTARAKGQLLSTTEATSGDYAAVKALTDGLGLGIAKDVWGRVTERADKSFAFYVYAAMSVGATRLEESKLVEIKCT